MIRMNYKICFVCTGNACRSPFAECVTKKLLADAGMSGIEVFSLGTLDWGENPRDAEMVDMARELGYEFALIFGYAVMRFKIFGDCGNLIIFVV